MECEIGREISSKSCFFIPKNQAKNLAASNEKQKLNLQSWSRQVYRLQVSISGPPPRFLNFTDYFGLLRIMDLHLYL